MLFVTKLLCCMVLWHKDVRLTVPTECDAPGLTMRPDMMLQPADPYEDADDGPITKFQSITNRTSSGLFTREYHLARSAGKGLL